MPNPIIGVFSDIPQSSETSAGSSAAQNTQRYKEIEQIAKYNRDNNTNFYTLAQIQEHQKKLQELERAKAVASNPDPEDVRDAYISALNPQTTEDVDKIRKWDKDAATTNGIGLAVAGTIPEMATFGVVPGLARYGLGLVTGHYGSRAGTAAGGWLDDKLGTKVFSPALGFVGGLAGYGIGADMATGIGRIPLWKTYKPLSTNAPQLTGHFGQVKYYGPTIGKTTAAKSNPKLVDFDDIIRQPSRNILDRFGFKNKAEMYNSGNQEAIKAYEDMLVKSLRDWRANPENSNLTLVASPTAIANPTKTGFYFDNVPSIPSRSVFIARNVGRGGTPEASAMWYDSLMKENPNLKIDNRFVSEIETPQPTTRLYRATGTSGTFTPSPDGTAEFAGQWFTDDPNKVWWYGENAFKTARKAGIENPIELQVVDMPTSQLEQFRAKNIIGDRKGIEFEPEDFIIPLDFPRRKAPLKLTGNLLFDQKTGLPKINYPYLSPKTSYKSIFMEEPIMGSSKGLTEAEKLGIPKGERNANIKESTLNWSWQDWFKDRINGNGHIKPTEFDKQSLYKHIPEYRQIETMTKKDGTWLKMPDGSIFEGDPREWVMAHSKAAQGLNFTDYYGLGSGQKPGYTIYFERQRNAPTMIDEIKGNFEGTPGRPVWLTDFKKAEGFANDGRGIGYTYKVYPQKGDSKAYFDLQGLDWDSIPVNVVKELNIPEGSGFVSTNRIISESPAQVIHLNNVAEGSGGASNIVNDVVIKGKRKSILGNNGNINWEDEVIWRKQGGKIKSIFKAQNGTFKDFWNTLPSNQRDSTDFNVRRYWELWGKPKTFNEALEKGAYKLENDGTYHAFSGAWNKNGEYEFTKSPQHPTVKYELDWFNSDDAKDFRSKYQLDSTSIPWKYKPINPQQ